MSSLRQSPLPTLSALSASLTDLTAILAPLVSQRYDQLNASLQSNSSSDDELQGRLDAARMQVSVAYVLMDLVWILLKTKGVDTKDHPVMGELERVKGYFAKIKRVQDKEEEKEGGNGRVDKSAAGRFIRAALQGEAGTGKHTKFDEVEEKARPKQVEKEKKESPKKKEPAASVEGAATTSTPKSKKKRPAMDPFEGYDKPKTPKAATPTDSPASTPSKKQKKNKKSSSSK